MNRLNQKGFTLIEGLLIVIALSLVAGVGFYVYKSTNDTKSSQSNSQTANQETKNQETKVTPAKSDKELIIDALAKHCADNPGVGAPALNETKVNAWITDSVQKTPSILVIDGNFARIDAGCVEKGSEEANGGAGGFRGYFQKKTQWEFLIAAQDAPGCDPFDGKGVPKSILTECYDTDTQDFRSPK